MNIMDISQISELATALIDSWASASSQDVIPQTQPSGTQAGDIVNKTFGNRANILPLSDNYFSSSTTVPGHIPSNVMEIKTEQIPMEEYDDPLESFSWWDGETFYCNQDYETGCSIASDMQTEDEFSTLPDFPLEDAMKREDLFQIRDVDLLHNPTLAELNCSGEPIFDIESSFLSDDASSILNSDALSKSLPQTESQFMNFSGMQSSNSFSQNVNILPTNFAERRDMLQSSLSSSCPTSSRAISCPQYLSISDEKFLVCPNNSPASDLFCMKRSELLNSKSVISLNTSDSTDSVFAINTLPVTTLLSSSAPADVAASKSFPSVHMEKSMHLLEGTNSYNAEKSPFELSSLSLSNDEESGSYFDDTDHDDDDDDDFSSDEDYQCENSETFSTSWPPGSDLKRACHHRKHRYFWQYNLQSRGLKGQNLPQLPEICDPHVLNDAMDPVFAEECSLPVKHSGKARKGDGNDLTPNPYKLYNIGLELKKLNKLIYDLTPANEMTSDTKPLSRKEKNKLASRVCRLKKKAQHEANKIKLYGLQKEHRQLLTLLMEIKQLVKFKIGNFQESKNLSCVQKFESYVILHGGCQVAENTTEFVNKVLDRVGKGECNGGLGDFFP